MSHPTGDQALHDVSNELTAALAWLDRAAPLAADRPELARALESATARVRVAIATARTELGAAVSSRRSSRHLAGLVEDVTRDLSAEAGRKRLTLAVERRDEDGEGPSLEPAAVRTVLTNLILNAIAFAPEGGTVRIVCAMKPDAAEVQVEDDGPGVPKELQESIFEGTSLRPGGAGHGLAHARRAAAALGGTLRIAPSARGARFVFRVAPRPRPLAGKRGVVVEDDADLRMLLDSALSAAGATVEAVSDTAGFFDAIRSGPHAFVLVDASPFGALLPEALELMAGLEPRPNVVVMSGKNEAPGLDQHSFALFLRKPFELRELFALLSGPPG